MPKLFKKHYKILITQLKFLVFGINLLSRAYFVFELTKTKYLLVILNKIKIYNGVKVCQDIVNGQI